MITDVADYFILGCGRCARVGTPDCVTRLWVPGLAELRRICRDTGMAEVAKWGHPCHAHAGRNVALIGALRGDFRLNFFQAALLSDPDALLERQGPNTQSPDCLRFADAGAVLQREPAIRGFLAQGMALAARGARAPTGAAPVDLPAELTDALDADPALAEAFAALTPGRRRGHVILLSSARQRATRIARIERARPLILAGKGAQDR